MRLNQDFKRVLSIYAVGFAGALLLSVASYLIVTEKLFGGVAWVTMLVLLILATVQLVVQLVCFLHLRVDRDPLSRTSTLIFAISTVLIIVIGSLWIMRNLDYRMHTSPEAMYEYMIEQNKKGF